ncbi:hypothetical protein PGT21_026521 [Puccinia graminis f. sp. tritici]|uniref:Uncharacterized protein n=1 Tax=Puccinia graminis f. sp. tritici TaxID=56615 RepID=A0A5B0QJV3_PUCGR|nr:hypothetical protein PGT21_026521 [Puccinia graminis f. sp. tritici]
MYVKQAGPSTLRSEKSTQAAVIHSLEPPAPKRINDDHANRLAVSDCIWNPGDAVHTIINLDKH